MRKRSKKSTVKTEQTDLKGTGYDEKSLSNLSAWLNKHSQGTIKEDPLTHPDTTLPVTKMASKGIPMVKLWEHDLHIDTSSLEPNPARFQGLVSDDFQFETNSAWPRAAELFVSRSAPAVPLLIMVIEDELGTLWNRIEILITYLKRMPSLRTKLQGAYGNIELSHKLCIHANEIVLTFKALVDPLTTWSNASAKLANDKTYRGLLDLEYPDDFAGSATVPYFYNIIHPPPLVKQWPPAALHSPDLSGLKTEPMQFQKNSISWMLQRELGNGQYPNLWISYVDLSDRVTYLQKELALITQIETDIMSQRSPILGGLLSDEMGLGKSLEVLSLIILHPRSECSVVEKVDVFTGNTVREVSTTLIVSPSTILFQWLNEAQKHTDLKVMYYSGINSYSKSPLPDFSDYDIVITSYAILTSEIYYATPASSSRTLRQPPVYTKKRSPMMQVEWWRVIMDEAQMIQSGNTAAARVACQLPRVNAWIVTGTPIATSCLDLYGLLHFLRIDPIYANSRLWQQMLSSASCEDYLAGIFQSISCRNTKALVAQELVLPPQRKYLFEVDLSALEMEAFRAVLRDAFYDLDLDGGGSPRNAIWENVDLAKMQRWITLLRQTCSHPQAGQQSRGIFSASSKPLLSLDEVLSTMQNNTARELEMNSRAYFTAMLEKGRILEYKKDRTDALKIWSEALPQLLAAVSRCEKDLYLSTMEQSTTSEVKPKSTTNDLRLWREILHRCLFFLGTIYFQLEQPDLEKEYYAKAKDIRKVLLSETEQYALSEMSSLKSLANKQDFVTIPEIKYSAFSGGVQTRNSFEKLQIITEVLNLQANQLDQYRELCVQRLTADLADQNDDPSGEEYQESAILQEESYAYQEMIKCYVSDRVQLVLGQSSALSAYDTQRAARQDEQAEVVQILDAGFKQRDALLHVQGKSSLHSIRAELRSKSRALAQAKDSQITRIELDIVSRALKQIDKDFSKQRECVLALQKETEAMNNVYNARLEYYRQFQTISDSVKEYTVLREQQVVSKFESALARARGVEQHIESTEADITDETRAARIDLALASIETEQAKLAKAIDQGKTRSRYLDYLGHEKTSESELCMICTQTIELGAFTICGHMYCKDCFSEWFRNHRACPICKTLLPNRDAFQTITLRPLVALDADRKQAGQITASHRLTKYYDQLDPEQKAQISRSKLCDSYSSKVDAILRHIISLPIGSKSVVYSNFLSVVEILASALMQNRVSFELVNGSMSKKVSQAQQIENFREDPHCSILLLWGKSQSSGLTLVNASNLFLVEPLLSPAVEQQIISRIHRIGQTNPTNVFQYVVAGTLEVTLLEDSPLRSSLSADQEPIEMTQEGQLLHTVTSLKSEEPNLDQAINLLKSNTVALESKDQLIGERDTLLGPV